MGKKGESGEEEREGKGRGQRKGRDEGVSGPIVGSHLDPAIWAGTPSSCQNKSR